MKNVEVLGSWKNRKFKGESIQWTGVWFYFIVKYFWSVYKSHSDRHGLESGIWSLLNNVFAAGNSPHLYWFCIMILVSVYFQILSNFARAIWIVLMQVRFMFSQDELSFRCRHFLNGSADLFIFSDKLLLPSTPPGAILLLVYANVISISIIFGKTDRWLSYQLALHPCMILLIYEYLYARCLKWSDSAILIMVDMAIFVYQSHPLSRRYWILLRGDITFRQRILCANTKIIQSDFPSYWWTIYFPTSFSSSIDISVSSQNKTYFTKDPTYIILFALCWATTQSLPNSQLPDQVPSLAQNSFELHDILKWFCRRKN
jgi:hypothetical protein